ncbi:hypothetical protein H70357_08655 [Paenibacillus sp. FSL H7-0357]|jgi:hypothetical protein|nr:hypothetical protein H70357_08655 [Paenibacillus sp. FSL H7-0357]
MAMPKCYGCENLREGEALTYRVAKKIIGVVKAKYCETGGCVIAANELRTSPQWCHLRTK